MNQPLSVLQGAAICPACTAVVNPRASFCSDCGNSLQRPAPAFGRHAATAATGSTHRALPGFIQPTPGPSLATLVARQEELAQVTAVLFRERFFLIMHWSLFLGINLWGLSLAVAGYNHIIGDPLTKLVMAVTPLVFINAATLMFFVCINGTRRQISRLKERIKYIQFQIDYADLI